MATITLTLPQPINISLQAKPEAVAAGSNEIDTGAWDVIYFVRIDNGKPVGQVFKLGNCISIAQNADSYNVEVSIDDDVNTQTPTTGDYIFFGKDNKIGTSGVVGYFAEVEMKNDSQINAELFAVTSEITQSSK